MLHHMLRAAAQRAFTVLDPYFKYVTMLLHGDGSALGSTTVTPFNADASTNNFNITINGDARSNNFNPYQAGYYSNYFNGSSAIVNRSNNTALAMGTGDFTIEFWINATSTSSVIVLYDSRLTTSSSTGGINIYHQSGTLYLYGGATTNVLLVSASITYNQWNHIAFVKSGSGTGNVKMYVNGVLSSTYGSADTSNYSLGYMALGAFYNPSPDYFYTGYFSNFRIVKGTAVYTSAFTPPTTPLTAISGTSLLTCQSNRFIDNSTNAFALTLVGSPQVAPAQPFTLPTTVATYGSGYFDGSGDYFGLGSQNALPTTTQDFTVEFWTYKTSAWSSSNQYFCNSNATGGLQIWVNTSAGFLRLGAYAVAPVLDYSFSNLQINTWIHIAYSRSGNSFALWVNGTRVATTTNSQNFGSSPTITTIAASDTGSDTFGGYISDFRVVRGAVVYNPSSTTITVPTTPLTAVSGTSLLTTQYNGAGNNNGFKDSSQNNFVITRNGNTTQGTFSPYGSNWSNYFSSNSGLTAPNNSAFKPATNDFTVEAWIFQTSSGTAQAIYGDSNASTDGGTFDLAINASGFLASDYWTSFAGITTRTSTLAPTVNQWNHVVISRTGTTIYLGLNGVLQSFVGPSSFQSPATTYPTVGRLGAYAAGVGFIGYISNFRYINGTNLYSGSTYTVPTAPLTAVANTQLLTCQSNRFIDNSTNNFAITTNGTPSVQRFSPFSPTSAYSTSVIGGSGYFDGSGDYLTTNYTINWSTYGSYTLEFWVYHTTMSPTNQMYFAGGTGGSGNTIFYNYANGRVGLGINGTNEIVSSSGVIKANTWQHIAYTFNGTTTIVYVDGVQVASGTTAVYANSSITLAVGGGSASSSFVMNGYIANMRLSQSVIYSSAFTPPTSPVTGGALLLNYTNAGVLDNAMMNDLETVGNAQISTSVKKYGTGSMYFDGTGDYLVMPVTPNLYLGSGDFCIEAWVYITSHKDYNFIYSVGSTIQFFSRSTGVVGFVANDSDDTSSYIVNIQTTTSISLNTWTHVAVVRNGSSFVIYINGVSSASGTSSAAIANSATRPCVGDYASTGGTSFTMTGYIDDLRITRGVARYSANFTPPTAAFPDKG